MRILITDGDTRSALAATRSLGRNRHYVVVAAERHPALASVSKYCAASRTYPSPVSDSAGFADAILDIVKEDRVDVLMPMTDISTLLLSECQSRLPSFCRFPFPDAVDVARAADKAFVLDLARSNGVPTPATRVAGSAVEAAGLGESLPYPVVIKPARSKLRTPTGWLSTGVSYARDPSDLCHRLQSFDRRAFPVLLQERIVGPGVGVFACYSAGTPVALFAHRRLREKPPSGGVSVLSESTALDPMATYYADLLLTRLNWRGIAMVEFKRDERDGSLRLMEINGRFWGSLQLAVDAGVDFPSIVVDLACGNPPQSRPPYRVGVRSRWLAGDLDAMLAMLIKSRTKLDLPDSHPGRLRALGEFLRFRKSNAHLEIERSDDLGPARLEWRRRILGR